MKLNPYFTIQQISGNYVLLPSGKTGWTNHGVIQLNEEEVLIVRYLTKEITEDGLISKLETEIIKPRDELTIIVQKILEKLCDGGALIE